MYDIYNIFSNKVVFGSRLSFGISLWKNHLSEKYLIPDKKIRPSIACINPVLSWNLTK